MNMCPNALGEKEQYVEWLYSQVMPDGMYNGYSYLQLLLHLNRAPFRVINPLDEARADEGRDLRSEYMVETHKRYLEGVLFPSKEATFLEVLIALSSRMAFEVCDKMTHTDAFVEMLRNAGLMDYDDDSMVSLGAIKDLEKRIDDIIDRNYGVDGSGGLFPLISPMRNQQQLPLFEQMEDYLNENFCE